MRGEIITSIHESQIEELADFLNTLGGKKIAKKKCFAYPYIERQPVFTKVDTAPFMESMVETVETDRFDISAEFDVAGRDELDTIKEKVIFFRNSLLLKKVVLNAVIEKNLFQVTIARKGLEENNISESNLINIVKTIWEGDLFYRNSDINLSRSINQFAYILTQDKIKYRYKCNHVEKVTLPYCPICGVNNVVVILPNETDKFLTEIYN